jgi:hypothetical protein
MPSDSNNSVVYRWVNGYDASDEDWDRIEEILKLRGWMALNRSVSRILLGEDAQGGIVSFLVFQVIPYVGPLFVVPSYRGNGVAQEMTDMMFQFLGEIKARGWIATAESPHARQIMEKYGMAKVETPVYVMPAGGAGGLGI